MTTGAQAKRVLIVDDEPQILRILRRSLGAHHFEVRVASDGVMALDIFADFPPDLVITDLQMPRIDGLELCKRIRELSQVPIIVLSVKGEEATKVAALDAGADDYVMKPFGMDELLARVRAALRRTPQIFDETNHLERGDFVIDYDTYSVTAKGRKLHFTPKEFELFSFLLKNDGKVLTHRKILASVWGANAVDQTEYLRVFVGNLRKKIELDPGTPKYILTEPWVGYRFSSDGS